MSFSDLAVLSMGSHQRLNEVLPFALEGIKHEVFTLENGVPDIRGRRVLIAESCGEWGIEGDYIKLLLHLRQHRDALSGCIGGIIIDGTSELYTKELGRKLIYAANEAGCFFPGKPLAEATGSLLNYNILSQNLNTDNLSAYKHAARALAERIAAFRPAKFKRPRILMLHASDRSTSNTLALGLAVCEQIKPYCDITEISLLNARINDCRGCGYHACSHFGKQNLCYYGDIVADDVYPALLECDALLMLCPNYNDTLSAKLIAFINRLTALAISNSFENKYLFGIVVSGYSGGDLVAMQLLGSLCLNKSFMLPPSFSMAVTAHEPGSALKSRGIEKRISAFADNMIKQLVYQ
ncbi:MAG: NADPH-dependent FMN reductase [Firmicutes bacterium ADurb.Bin182]|nr:MAG: NADPH-dependent FMN reductase [Firmicutes bacterium ADurb.Bin182]